MRGPGSAALPTGGAWAGRTNSANQEAAWVVPGLGPTMLELYELLLASAKSRRAGDGGRCRRALTTAHVAWPRGEQFSQRQRRKRGSRDPLHLCPSLGQGNLMPSCCDGSILTTIEERLGEGEARSDDSMYLKERWGMLGVRGTWE